MTRREQLFSLFELQFLSNSLFNPHLNLIFINPNCISFSVRKNIWWLSIFKRKPASYNCWSCWKFFLEFFLQFFHHFLNAEYNTVIVTWKWKFPKIGTVEFGFIWNASTHRCQSWIKNQPVIKLNSLWLKSEKVMEKSNKIENYSDFKFKKTTWLQIKSSFLSFEDSTHWLQLKLFK